jgi:hypothetical protein
MVIGVQVEMFKILECLNYILSNSRLGCQYCRDITAL